MIIPNSIFYHGSHCKIDDIALAAGTWLTTDIGLAREHGGFVYRVELPDDHIGIIYGPNWEGHYVTKMHIPWLYVKLIENNNVEENPRNS